MTTTATLETVEASELDFDALEATCGTTIEELQASVARLSLDALTDPEVRLNLIDAEHRLSEAEHELTVVARARAERERRDHEALQKAMDAKRQQHYVAAQKLQPAREQAAVAVDEAAQVYVRAITQYVTAAREQQAELLKANQPHAASAARPNGFAIQASFALALRDARWNRAFNGLGLWDRLPLISPNRQKPLAELDARAVEPVEPGTKKDRSE